MKGSNFVSFLFWLAILCVMPFATAVADLEVEITSEASDPIAESQALTFVITVSNTGLVPIENVVISVPTPEFMTVADAETSSGNACVLLSNCYADEPLAWDLGALEPGGVRSVFFSDGAISSNAVEGSLITAVATVTGDGVPSVQASRSVTITETLPSVQLAMSADRGTVAPGSLVTFRLRYSNLALNINGDELAATVPPGTSFVSANGGGTLVGDQVRWQIGAAAFSSGSREFTVLVEGDFADGALLRSDAEFSNTLNGAVARANDLVAVRATVPSLSVSVSSAPDPVEKGRHLGFLVTISNPGDAPVSGVSVAAPTPDFMLVKNVETSSGTACERLTQCDPGRLLSWDVGTIEPGAVRTVLFSGRVISTDAVEGSLVTALALVSGTGVSTAKDSHTVKVSEGVPALQLAMSAEHDQAAPGSLVTYRLRYSNASPTVIGNELVARVPDGTSFYSAGEGGELVGDEIRWSIGSAAYESGVREFTVLVDNGLADGRLLRSEAGYSDTVGGASAFANEVVAVRAAEPALRVSISSTPDPVEDVRLLSFMITVSNSSTSSIGNVAVLVPTPAFMSVDDIETSSYAACARLGACASGHPLTWSLGTIEPGGVRTVFFSDARVSTYAVEGSLVTAAAVVSGTGVSTAKASHTVKVSEGVPALQLAMSAEHDQAAPGSLVTYRLRYSNASSTVIGNELVARVPDGTSFYSAGGGGVLSGDEVRWSIGRAAFGSGTREFTVLVDNGLADGALLRLGLCQRGCGYR